MFNTNYIYYILSYEHNKKRVLPGDTAKKRKEITTVIIIMLT